jgi:lipid A 3-O-deacylase
MLGARGLAATIVAALLLLPTLARADDPGLLAVGVGDMDFDHKQPSPEYRGEYRFSQGIFFIKPIVGGFATGAHSVYVYGGLRVDLIFLDHYVVEPNAAVGYYNKGSGKNLGSPVEFKTGVEFAYRFDNAARLGLAFDHISNAGLSQRNPGTEQLLVMLSWPLW